MIVYVMECLITPAFKRGDLDLTRKKLMDNLS